MARKSRKAKLIQRAESVHDSVPETGGPPKPAIIIMIAIVLLFVGVTIGVVIDVMTRSDPLPAPAPQSAVRPKSTAPPVIVNAPRQTSIFDEAGLAEQAALPRPLSPATRHAVSTDVTDDTPVIAVVIDDMGLDQNRTARVTALPGPLTLSYLTYAKDLPTQSSAARDAGHEIMAHIPMEPLGPADPGPGALVTGATDAELRSRLKAYLDGWDGYVGINNHMGSKLTADESAMAVVMDELRSRGLLWLDSRTDSATVGEEAAAALGVPHVGRDVFLDNEDDRAAIDIQLGKLETLARRQGYAVAIGHPRDNTIQALAAWLPTLESKGLALVPVTEVVRRTFQ